MSILNHFSRIQPARQEKEDEKDVPPEIDAESSGDDSDFDPAPKPANPRKRSANPQNETTNDEKAKVVKWYCENGKNAAAAAREFNYNTRAVQRKF